MFITIKTSKEWKSYFSIKISIFNQIIYELYSIKLIKVFVSNYESFSQHSNFLHRFLLLVYVINFLFCQSVVSHLN